jgi:hypothetical protein
VWGAPTIYDELVRLGKPDSIVPKVALSVPESQICPPRVKVLLDDILDRDGWLDGDSARVRVFGQQQRRIALDHFVGKVGNELGHVIRILFCICICIVEIGTA